MADLVEVPYAALEAATRNALLEEFASRDGTDYGLQETPLERRVEQLDQLWRGAELLLLYDSDSEQWDLLTRERAQILLQSIDGAINE